MHDVFRDALQSDIRAGIICFTHFVFVTRRAAMFWSLWSLLRCSPGNPPILLANYLLCLTLIKWCIDLCIIGIHVHANTMSSNNGTQWAVSIVKRRGPGVPQTLVLQGAIGIPWAFAFADTCLSWLRLMMLTYED